MIDICDLLAQCGRTRLIDPIAICYNFTALRFVKAQQLGKRCFPAAAFADDRDPFSPVYGEVDSPQGQFSITIAEIHISELPASDRKRQRISRFQIFCLQFKDIGQTVCRNTPFEWSAAIRSDS